MRQRKPSVRFWLLASLLFFSASGLGFGQPIQSAPSSSQSTGALLSSLKSKVQDFELTLNELNERIAKQDALLERQATSLANSAMALAESQVSLAALASSQEKSLELSKSLSDALILARADAEFWKTAAYVCSGLAVGAGLFVLGVIAIRR